MAKKPQKNFYAVRVGRKVGIYTTWDDCKEQVNGFRAAASKGFSTLGEAQQFMNEGQAPTQAHAGPPPATQAPTATPTPTPTINGLRAAAVQFTQSTEVGTRKRVDALRQDAIKAEPEDDGPGCYFEKFSSQEHKFQPDAKAKFSQEFDRLASSQGWARGSPRYKTERVTALSDQVWTHFFKDALEERDTGRPARREGFGRPAESGLADPVREESRKLRGFQALCRAVGREPGGALEECKMILKGTLVNIVDLIDACRTGKLLEVWTDFYRFKRYTLDDEEKTIPLHLAKHDEVLKCFLQKFGIHGQKMYEALSAQLGDLVPTISQVGVLVNRGTGSSSPSSRWENFPEREDDRSPTPSPFTSPYSAPLTEDVENTGGEIKSSPSRGRALVSQQGADGVAIKRERSESPVFLFERPCKKRVVISALAKDVQSSLADWPKLCLTQEPIRERARWGDDSKFG